MLISAIALNMRRDVSLSLYWPSSSAPTGWIMGGYVTGVFPTVSVVVVVPGVDLSSLAPEVAAV